VSIMTLKLCVLIAILSSGIVSFEASAMDSNSSLLPDAPSASRQTSPDSPTQQHGFIGTAARRIARDQIDIYTAPFHRSAIKWDFGFLAITGVLIATDKHASGELSRHPSSASSDISNIGLGITGGSVGVLLLDGLLRDNPHARETGILGAESMANSGILYTLIQLGTGRDRPLQDSGRGGFWQNSGLDNSFPSGHAIISWTAASVVAHEYPKPWVEWLSYGAATAVSITRFTSVQHFPSDVFVGSTLGYLIGRHVFHVHCKQGLSSACHAK
jgi:hypothetical protein